ncbi:inositol monophosphatase [Falsihalocynthiibacter arcticus]|uniref:inositol monophosphatase family protein n=1 Tax=Falsihalocynthiibacter arcticus TaxID=1579316 RepID=UPI003002F298
MLVLGKDVGRLLEFLEVLSTLVHLRGNGRNKAISLFLVSNMNMSNFKTGDANEIGVRATFAVELIRRAGKLAQKGFAAQSQQKIMMKGPQDFLTETDLAVEEYIKSALLTKFPNDGFFGEETAGIGEENYWVVDPIDGTANFARGIPHYCIAIAFVSNNEIELGLIFNPPFDELYVSRKGAGTTRNGDVVRVSDVEDIDSTSVEVGWSNRLPNLGYLNILAAVLSAGANARRASSGALGLAYVADGRSDGYVELHMNAWDCLAGLLMVREAGGVIAGTCLTGDLRKGGSVLAATPKIAPILAKASDIAIKY